MPVIPVEHVPDPYSSYLEHDGKFKPWLFQENTFCELLDRLRQHPDQPASSRLLTFMAANFSYRDIPDVLKKELQAQGRVCLNALQNEEQAGRIADKLQNLMTILERVNHANYQIYLKDGTHMLMEKFMSCESYIELNKVFCLHLYSYACYRSKEEVARALAAALNIASAFLKENPLFSRSQKNLARCVDMYRGVITGQIRLPIPHTSTLFCDGYELGGYEWLQHFLRYIKSEWRACPHFCLLETGQLAHRAFSLAKAREMTPMINRGTLRRDGNKCQFRRIHNSLVRMIIGFAFPILLSKSDVDLDRVVKVELAECALTRADAEH